MFYSLTGRLVFSDSESIAIDCGGVAYLCATTMNTLGKVGDMGKEVTLYTYLAVRENAMDLYGFADLPELSTFKMLISVKGVGPRSALGILSHITPEQIAFSIASDDYKTLTSAPGVGNKTAQRIVLELKDKVSNDDIKRGLSVGAPTIKMGIGNISEAITALVALGYTQGEAASSLAGLDSGAPVQDLIKTALKVLAHR